MTRFSTKWLGRLCLTVLCFFSLQDVAAQCSEGEVSVGIQIDATGDFFGEVEWELLDGSGGVVASNCAPSDGECTQVCLTEGTTYTMNFMDSFGDGWNGNTYNVFVISGDNAGCEIASGSPGNSAGLGDGVDCGNEIEEQIMFDPGSPACSTTVTADGCTDPEASNFNPCAATDDGSCIYPPDNDLCADAETIECGDVLSGTTVGATFDDVGSCVTSNTSPGVWYHFIGTGADVTVDICNAPYDSKMSIFEGDCGDLVCVIGEDDDFTVCGGNDPSVDFTSVKCKDYYILVHGFSSSTGDFDITLTCSEDIEVVAEGCTDPNAHNYEAAACNDDGSCETCEDGILNGDELDVDCGGALCDSCPCDIESTTEVAVYDGGCESPAQQRVTVVQFSGGIAPVDYDVVAGTGVFISLKGPGTYQVVGTGSWSLEASDVSGCINRVDSDDFVYVSATASTPETNLTQNGTASVTVMGGTAPYTVEWSNGTEGSIAAAGGSHTNTGLGKGNYEALVTDADGGTALACVNVARVNSTGGRGGRGRGRKAEIADVNTFIAQPNPLSSYTVVRFNLPETSEATVNIFSLEGKKVATVFEGQAEEGQNYNVTVDASELASGVYILQLTTESGIVAHQRIVVAK